MPIKIDFISNVTRFLRGTEDAEKALDDVADSLDDVVRDGDKAERELERNFREVADAAKDASKSVARVGDAADDGLGKVRAGAQEVTQEMGQNLGGAVSTVRGDLSDLGQVGQDTLGGLAATVAGMGPAGVAGALALAAGAVGLGALTAGLEEAEEDAQKLRDRAGEVASAWIDAGTKMTDAATINSAIQSIVGDQEQMKLADELVKKLGVDLPTAIRILAGDQNALTTSETMYHEKLREREALEEKIRKRRGPTTLAERKARKELREWIETYEKQASVFDNASDLFTAASRAQSDALLDYIRIAGTATEQTDELGNKLYTLPDGHEIVLDVDTGRATLNLDEFKGDVEKIPKRTVTTVGVQAPTTAEIDRAMSIIQKRVARGVPVVLRPEQGWAWK